MQGRMPDIGNIGSQQPQSTYMLATVRMKVQQPRNYTFSIDATVPPVTEVHTIMQRGDEVNSVLRMLTDLQTSAVMLTGDAGVGTSTLAALLYRRLQITAQAGLPAPRHFVWLSLGTYTTVPELIASILSSINIYEPAFFLLKPELQIATLLQALRRGKEPALVVLDHFDNLLDSETGRVAEGRGDLALFLQMLQQDLGVSRFLLTCQRSPYGTALVEETRIRSFLLSRISLPEGVALLQQYGIQGTHEGLSLVWQRCGGHVFALALFHALLKFSGLAPGHLLTAPEYQPLWSSEVPLHLVAVVYHYLNPIQRALVRTLSLFKEPVAARGLFMAIEGENQKASLPAFEQELNALVQLSLVQQVQGTQDETHYTLHTLVRQYVLEHYLLGSGLQPSGRSSNALGVTGFLAPIADGSETEQAQEVAVAAGHMRVAAYYQQLAQERYIPRDKRSSAQDIMYVLATIRHQCLGWHWQQACDLLLSEAVYESMVQWGNWNALIGLYMEMLPPNGVLTRRDEGLICNHLGLLYDRLGNAQQSWAYYERALMVQRKVGDQHGAALTLTNQGELFRSQNNLPEAYKNFEQARELNKQLHDSLLESVLLHNLGLMHYAAKDYAQALNYYREALFYAQMLDEHYNEGMILTNIGVLLYEQGYYPEALAVLFYTLRMRQSLQYTTVSFIERFLTTLEDMMPLEVFTQLRQASREVEAQVLSRLIPANMRQ